MACLEIFLHLQALNVHYHSLQVSDQVTMPLAFDSEHIIYYNMDALWSVGLAQTDFPHPHYLVVQCWVCTTYPWILLTKMGPKNYHCVKFFEGWVAHMPLGTPCNHIMAIIDQTNAAMLFVVYHLSSFVNCPC